MVKTARGLKKCIVHHYMSTQYSYLSKSNFDGSENETKREQIKAKVHPNSMPISSVK